MVLKQAPNPQGTKEDLTLDIINHRAPCTHFYYWGDLDNVLAYPLTCTLLEGWEKRRN